MKICLDIQFEIPIWRLFYDKGEVNKIPYEFLYNNKTYRNGITIIQLASIINENLFKHNNFMNNLKCQNPIICAPNIEIYNLFKKYRSQYTIIIANHNAFIDENVYNISNENKIYDIIVNSSFTKLKRLYLVEDIKNIIFIGYKCGDLKEFNESIPKNGYLPNFGDKERILDNWNWLDRLDVIKFYNQSKVGGIFSPMEGACFSSSEYLLCGLPVISTECKGGREYWYNNKNSIICKPNKENISQAIELAIKKIETQEFNSSEIRNNHIELMNKDRNTLTNAVLEKFKGMTNIIPEYNLLFDSLKYYHSNNNHKSVSYDKIQTEKEFVALKVLEQFNYKSIYI